MIKVRLTKNYTGFNIEGTFEDFYELYDSISYFLGIDECDTLIEEDMRLHILGFLYDLRHAYQGDRYVTAVDNHLCDSKKEWHKIDKLIEKDIVYSFDYLITDLLLDILLFKHFAMKYKDEITIFNTNYNMANFFYSLVIDSLSEMLEPSMLNEVKNMLMNTTLSEKTFLTQWFIKLDIDYINMSKNKRKRDFISIVKLLCDSNNYPEFKRVKKEVVQCAKENSCDITMIEYGEFPQNIKW